MPMSGCGEQQFNTEALNLGLVIFNPVSSVPGSPSFFFLQPIITGKVFASAGVLIGAQLFLFLAQRLFNLDRLPVNFCELDGKSQLIEMSSTDLQEFLKAVACGDSAAITKHFSNPIGSTGGSGGLGSLGSLGSATGPTQTFATPTTIEAPLVVGIAIYGDFSSQLFSPLVFFTVPIFTVSGIRGALPILILETLSTIFVRAVVPPETTGAKPIPETSQSRELLHFTPEDLLTLFSRFGKYFVNK